MLLFHAFICRYNGGITTFNYAAWAYYILVLDRRYWVERDLSLRQRAWGWLIILHVLTTDWSWTIWVAWNDSILDLLFNHRCLAVVIGAWLWIEHLRVIVLCAAAGQWATCLQAKYISHCLWTFCLESLSSTNWPASLRSCSEPHLSQIVHHRVLLLHAGKIGTDSWVVATLSLVHSLLLLMSDFVIPCW